MSNNIVCKAYFATEPHSSACEKCRFMEECDRQGYIPSSVADERIAQALADQGLNVSAHPEDQGVTWQVLEVR